MRLKTLDFLLLFFLFCSQLLSDRFGPEVMDTVVSWTKSLCIDISRRRLLNHIGDDKTEHNDHEVHHLSSWSVLDLGTGNGLLLQELAKHGY